MSAQAGWYPEAEGSSTLRYWDGTQWTDQTREAASAASTSNFGAAIGSAAERMMSTDMGTDPDTIWEATGKPVTGIGAGRYRLTAKFLYFEKGTLRTQSHQIPTNEIYDVDCTQTMTQKARGVGTIKLVVRSSSDHQTVVLEDVPDFRAGVRALNEAAHAERERLQRLENTQTFQHSGGMMSSMAGMPAMLPATGGADAGAIKQLASLYKAGVLSAEEFAAKVTPLIEAL